MARMKITDVFTPRLAEVNPAMYVARPQVEKALRRSIEKNIHTLLFGDSGNGKSWLYKSVLKAGSVPHRIANCANASRLGSLTNEIYACLIDSKAPTQVSYTESKKAEIGALFAKGELEHTKEFVIGEQEKLLDAFAQFDKEAPGKKILVLDNLESIFDNDALMSELADLIILLDDARYSRHQITLLIVGTPSDVLEYFSRTKNLESVSNRVEEMPKIGSLESEQVEEIVRKGFEQLAVRFTGGHFEQLTDHTYRITLGVAQRVHEYCESLAYVIEDGAWIFKPEMLSEADDDWLQKSLRQCYTVIDRHLNSRDTTVARRNQVIYVIGNRITAHSFDSNTIDAIVRKEFPETVPETNMGIGSILADLSSGDAPLLRRVPNSNEFMVTDPRYLMCIRVVLYRGGPARKVTKRKFKAH